MRTVVRRACSVRKEDLRDTKLSLTLLVMIVPYHYLEAQQDEEV